MDEKILLLSELLINWKLSENNSSVRIIDSEEDELLDGSFVSKVIIKRMRVFEVPIKVPLELLGIIELGLNSNPCYSLACFYKILRKIPDLKPNHTITTDDFTRAFPDYFPDMDNPDHAKKLDSLWDNQKTPDRRNKVDNPDYWLDLFK